MNKLFAIALLLFSSTAWAGTAYYVDPGAAGGGTGTYASPWNSIAQVNAKSFSTGDDVYFKAGTTLTMTAYLNIDWSATETDRIVIGAYYGDGQFGLDGGARPILDGNSWTVPAPGSYAGLINHVGSSSYITIQDLQLKDSGMYGVRISGLTTGHNEVKNCYVYRPYNQGIIIDRSSYNLIEDNIVSYASYRRIATGQITMGAAIEITAMHNEASAVYNVVRGNTVSYSTEGIGLYKQARYATVENNTVYDCRTYHIYLSRCRNNTVRNNTVYATASSLAGTSRGSGIVVASELEGYTFEVATGWHTIENNYVGGMGYGLYIIVYSTATIGQKGLRITGNRLADNAASIKIVERPLADWSDNEITGNYSFVFTSGFVHTLEENPEGFTWSANHYNTSIDGVSGNAATDAVYDDPDLVKTTGWRTLTAGAITESDFAFVVEPTTPPSGSALDATNAYGGGTHTPLIAYLFDNATGTTLTDYSGNEDDATLTNPEWTTNGLDMKTVGQKISVPTPPFGDDFTLFFAFTSTATSSSEWGKFLHYYNATFRDLLIERKSVDNEYRIDINNTYAYPLLGLDLFDLYFHTVMVTFDDSSNERCMYFDGSLQVCSSEAYTNPAWTSSFWLGSDWVGNNQLMATLHGFYAWNSKLTSADAVSLHADYDQMFTDPPSRAFNTPTPAAPGPLRRVTTTISTMPMVTTRSQ